MRPLDRKKSPTISVSPLGVVAIPCSTGSKARRGRAGSIPRSEYAEYWASWYGAANGHTIVGLLRPGVGNDSEQRGFSIITFPFGDRARQGSGTTYKQKRNITPLFDSLLHSAVTVFLTEIVPLHQSATVVDYL